MRDEFLSEEDLDLRNLSEEELQAWWTLWFAQAQASNDLDRDTYSHGVFMNLCEPPIDPAPPGPANGELTNCDRPT